MFNRSFYLFCLMLLYDNCVAVIFSYLSSLHRKVCVDECNHLLKNCNWFRKSFIKMMTTDLFDTTQFKFRIQAIGQLVKTSLYIEHYKQNMDNLMFLDWFYFSFVTQYKVKQHNYLAKRIVHILAIVEILHDQCVIS